MTQGDNLHYKGYEGSVLYSTADDCLHGQVLGIRSVLGYGGESLAELKAMFEAAVDDYLALCARRGIQPEQPRPLLPQQVLRSYHIGAVKNADVFVQNVYEKLTADAGRAVAHTRFTTRRAESEWQTAAHA